MLALLKDELVIVTTELSKTKAPVQVPVVPVSVPSLTWYVPPPAAQLKETIAAWAGVAAISGANKASARTRQKPLKERTTVALLIELNSQSEP